MLIDVSSFWVPDHPRPRQGCIKQPPKWEFREVANPKNDPDVGELKAPDEQGESIEKPAP